MKRFWLVRMIPLLVWIVSRGSSEATLESHELLRLWVWASASPHKGAVSVSDLIEYKKRSGHADQVENMRHSFMVG